MLSHFSRVRLFATRWIVAHQAPLSMKFSRQEFWSGLPCPPPRDLPDPGIEPKSLTSPALAGGYFFFFYHLCHQGNPRYAHMCALIPQSCPTLVTPWTVARQAALSVGFSRQEYWSGYSPLQNTYIGTIKCKHVDVFYMDILHRDLEYLRALGYVSRT